MNEAFEKAVGRKNSEEAKHRELSDLIAKYGRILKLGGRPVPTPHLRTVESQSSLKPKALAIVGSSISRDATKSVLSRCGPCGKGHDQVTSINNYKAIEPENLRNFFLNIFCST